MTYKRTTVSREIRDRLLVEAMHRCCLCPQHEDITEIHHIVPIREEGPNTEENLMVVCPTCHAKIHRIRTMYTPKQLKMYKKRWVNLCANGLPLEECLIKVPGITLPLPLSLHNQTPPEPNFVGRAEMLATITEWYNNLGVRVGALIGWGGVGKSALMRKWLDSMSENGIRPDGVFWWGFYRNAYLERFLDALLEYLARRRIGLAEIKGTWQKVEKIKGFIVEGEYLIILDGLEEMQKKEKAEEFGKMQHPELKEILTGIADANCRGLCLITTRFPMTDVETYF